MMILLYFIHVSNSNNNTKYKNDSFRDFIFLISVRIKIISEHRPHIFSQAHLKAVFSFVQEIIISVASFI